MSVTNVSATFRTAVIVSLAARLRIHVSYAWRHRRVANIKNPRLFTEHIQHRKLHDRDPRLPDWADKVRAKALATAMLGCEWAVPILWAGRTLPAEPCWPMPFMVKARHGCGQYQAVRSAADYAVARMKAKRWMRSTYGRWLDEWLYGRIAPGLLVEPLIGAGPNLPIDYKLFVFGGRVRLVQVHLGRGGNHRWIVMDRDWRRVSSVSRDPDPDRPHSLDRMIWAAEQLGRDFAFVRVDFYDVDGEPLFGEMTFYPGSGLERIDPPELDARMGQWCTAALVATAPVKQEALQAAA